MSTSVSRKLRLSKLQRFLLETTLSRSGKVPRRLFDSFYPSDSRVRPTLRVKIITKTMERLIEKGMFVGYGVQTAEKWYIKEVRLTPEGRRLARRLAGEQQHLPLDS